MKKVQKSNKKQYLCSDIKNRELNPLVAKQVGTLFIFWRRIKKSDEKSTRTKQKAVSLQQK
jgi:hypothetical protein